MTTALLEMKLLTPERDCRAYLVWDPASREAAVIDVRFDAVQTTLPVLRELGLTLRYAIDTHTHADHLSGSDRLRNLTGCKVVMSSATRSKVPNHLVQDGATLKLGDHDLRFVHTPGHTPDSMCIFDGARVFTGDTLFINSAARTDFMGGSSEQLFESFRKIEALGPDVQVWPGHDYNGKQSSTVGAELQSNAAFKDSKPGLVDRLNIKGMLPAHMAEILSFNTEAGLPEARILKPEQVAALGTPGKDFTLLDVRYADEWAAGRAPGAVFIPMPDLRARWAELEKLPRPIVSVCRSGVRATTVMMTARHAGDEGWLLLEGGMLAWQQAGLPLECDSGQPKIIASKQSVGGSCQAGDGTCAAS
ncbi:MAG: MBL fold metallo-hydrolase [Planctomycetes bacterium]|nr:MBL fold metallo-hydrolase [Planctomycetota bacterium]MCW8134184.1 MBL fold metallo-hydrolase [Planctomycetota bacterium]